MRDGLITSTAINRGKKRAPLSSPHNYSLTLSVFQKNRIETKEEATMPAHGPVQSGESF